jgi:mono/diheme cytochrome c family protein
MQNMNSLASRLSTVCRLMLIIGTLVIPVTHAVEDTLVKGDPVEGSRTWIENCGRCHGLRDPSEFGDDVLRPIVYHMRIRAGLTGKQTRDVLEFLRASNFSAVPVGRTVTTETPEPVATELGRGERIYRQTCVTCHGENGKGAFPGVPDFTDVKGPIATKEDDVLLKHTIEGFKSPDSVMIMPAKGGNPALSEEDIKQTLRYIREMFGT